VGRGGPMSGPTSRISFRFSADGAEAACLAGDGTAGLRVESWSLAGGMPYARVRGRARTETVRSQPVPTGDGRVLVARTGAGSHDVVLVEEDETLIARLTGRGVRLLPSPRPGTLGVAVVTDAAGRGTVERVTRSGLERLIDLPGAVAGGFWLDGSGR